MDMYDLAIRESGELLLVTLGCGVLLCMAIIGSVLLIDWRASRDHDNCGPAEDDAAVPGAPDGEIYGGVKAVIDTGGVQGQFGRRGKSSARDRITFLFDDHDRRQMV